MKHVLSDLNRTLAQSGPNNELTEQGFNKALRRSRKDTGIGFDAQISRTEQKRTRLGCTLSTKKALTKAIFPKSGQIAS